MKDEKIKPVEEPKFSSIIKWLDNFWYHYKIHTIIAAIAIVTVVVSAVQLLTRTKFDYHMLYAGPQVIAVQDLYYMRDAMEAFADDYDGSGEIAVSIDDIVMLSPEEIEEAKKNGAVLNMDFMNQSMNEYYQQIFGGDDIICMLSPYMYEIVHAEGGFLPLSELFEEIPDSAYDDCGIVLSKTDFGKEFNGINDLPDDTILCIRRLSSMAKFKGEKKTRAAHEASCELFKKIVSYESPEETAEK